MTDWAGGVQSSDLDLERMTVAPTPTALERFSWLDKAPLSVGFGCVLGLSAPGFDQWWLAWVGLAPLLVLIRSARGKIDATATGFLFGMGYYLVCLSWYLGLYPLRWIGVDDWLGFQAAAAIWLLEAVHQSILFGTFALFVFALPLRTGFLPWYRRPFFPYLLSIPLIWIFLQWGIGTWEGFLGVPVNQLAYSQWQQTELIQMAKWGGSQFVDGVLLVFNAALACMFIEVTGLVARPYDRVDRLSARGGALVDLATITLVALGLFVWGHGEVNRVAAETRLPPPAEARLLMPPVPVAVVQGNVSIEDERLGSLSPGEIAQRYAMLGHELGVPLLFLPEGVVDKNQLGQGLLFSQLANITSIEKKEAVVGCLQPAEGGNANCVRLITPRREENVLYVKRRLVPFGEYIPVGPVAHLLPPQIKHLFIGPSETFVQARSARLLRSLWGNIGASICNEVIYPRLIADEVRHGASLLVNLSNLAWFHGSTLNRQLLAASIFRAVENGRFMVVAANTGVSAVIDPSGLVLSASLPGRKGVVLNTVQFLYRKTQFTKMWWL